MVDDADESLAGNHVTAERLLERATADPDAVDLEDVLTVVTEGDPDDTLITAFRTALRAGAIDAERATERVVDLLGDHDYAVRLHAGKMAVELGAEAPGAVVPQVDSLVDVAASDDLTADSAMTALRSVARFDPEALLGAIDRLSDVLDNDLATAREDALAAIAWLATDHPSALVELAPDLVLAANVESPTVPGRTASDTGARKSDAASTERRGVTGEATEQGQAGDQNAAYALVQIAAAEPAAVEPHLPDVNEVVEADGSYANREYLLDAIWRVAEARPRMVVDDVDALIGALGDDLGATPGMRAAAARALTALAEFDGATVTAAVVGSEGAFDACRALLEAEEPQARASAASLFAYLSEFEPDPLVDAWEDLLACLDDGNQSVRGSAVWALRFLGPHLDEGAEAKARRALETVAAEDPSREIRRLASHSVDVMEHGQ